MAEWLLRHTLPFLLIVLLVRWLVWPRFGKNGVVELLLINAVGDLAAHAAFEEQHPLLSGLGGILLWLLMVAGMGAVISRSRAARRWLGYFDQPVEIVRDGRTDDEAMRSQRVSREELESELRQQSLHDLAGVRSVTVEPDGAMAVSPGGQDTGQELRRLADELAALRLEIQELRKERKE
ncbi:MAG TPA: YetF domain-containing protein [Symbiobacteriaceae bacterium]|nr:YetF domain-containing protein [Symbiobacteriaceae bacterium]